MARRIGVLATRYIWAGVVDENELGPVRMFPEPGHDVDLKSVPAEEIIGHMTETIAALHAEGAIESVGAGLPGIVRDGLIEESPNLGQLKGLRIEEKLAAALAVRGIRVPVCAMNDADAMAAGIAATRGSMESLVRVWNLGDGVGLGHYPIADGAWEGGHMVVSLDPKENYCGCGGQGHLEGIVGNRAMRLRFLDMEPEEIFAAARHGDERALTFVKRWHRALAAATAGIIHLDGPGRFYIAGANADFVDLSLLNMNLQDMVKMSSLQGTYFEIVGTSHDIAMIGAAIASRRLG